MNQWPRVFSTSGHAVRFADGLLDDVRIQSSMRLYAMMRRSASRGRSFTMQDFLDQAHTISVELAKVPGPPGMIYRYVFGHGMQHAIELSDQAAHAAWSGPGNGCAAKCKTIAQCRQLAMLVLKDVRGRALWRRKLPAKEMARQMRITRAQFYEQWGDERREITEVYLQWIQSAERALYPVLEQLGIVKQIDKAL